MVEQASVTKFGPDKSLGLSISIHKDLCMLEIMFRDGVMQMAWPVEEAHALFAKAVQELEEHING